MGYEEAESLDKGQRLIYLGESNGNLKRGEVVELNCSGIDSDDDFYVSIVEEDVYSGGYYRHYSEFSLYNVGSISNNGSRCTCPRTNNGVFGND